MHRLPTCWLPLALVLGGCAGGSGYSWDEVARVRAPDARAEAVLIETNGGATTSFGYLVFIVAPGASVPRTGRGVGGEAASLYGAVRSDSAYGANLRWLGRDTLAVEYQRADEDSLLVPAVHLADRTIQVVLRAGVTDPTAPAGGMQYNRVERAPLRR